jgi:hypothetical protein
MREKGYQRPVDVWFDNIKAILELKMDPKREWMQQLLKNIYPDDAMWCITHMQSMYLALCTPSDQDDEFLLTENAYSIHEGPVSSVRDPTTGKMIPGPYTEFHLFAVISPKLMMVLRSSLLPIPEEDSNENIKRQRQEMFHLNAIEHVDPESVNSFLEDLPVTKARNSYTKLVDGKLVLQNGEDGSPRPYHKFCFRFFQISTEHVNKINCVMLEEAYFSSKIVFKSQLGARKTLEYYLTMPCEGVNGFKLLLDGPNDSKLLYLKKLEQAAKQLGSNATATYQVLPVDFTDDAEFEALSHFLEKALPKEPSKFMKLYMKLG